MMPRQKQRPESAETGIRYSDALNHINMVIHSGLDFDSIMAKVVVEIARTIGAESAVIFLPENNGWVAKYTYGLPEEMLNQHFAAEELSYSALAAQRKSAVVIDDPSHDSRVKSDIILRYGIRAILDVALTIHDKMIGNFSIHYHTATRKFTDLEVDFVNKAASTITLALKNALLLQERKEAEEALRANERKMLQTLDRLMILVGVSSRVLAETTIQGTLNQAVAGALAITDALVAASGHGYTEGELTLGALATDAPFPPCPTDIPFNVLKGGVHLDLLHKVSTIRLTQEELSKHPLWWGLPEGHAPLNGLLGARLEGAEGKPNGMILVSHKRHGQFTEEDEVLLTQLCQLTSLALRHIEARHAVEAHAVELETIGRQLKESEERFREFFTNAPVGMVIMDTQGKFVEVNNAYCDIFGYDRKEIHSPDFTFIKMTHPDDVARNLAELNQVLAGEKRSLFIEKRNQRKDGRYIWVRVSATACSEATGRPVRIIAIVEDIQDRKQVEEDLKQAMEELSRSNRELEQFAYIASHDLQEPLRMVSSYVKLLERKYRGRLDATADTYIDFAVNGVGRMQKLIEGLLAYSRISRGVGFKPVDTAVPLRAALANLEPATVESAARVSCSTPLPTVLGDETQLMQLFQNLVGNALKYRKKTVAPRVVISASPTTDGWVFRVEDNGIGIEPRHFDRIFQIFQRLHGQDEYEGTGIGLASCKKIVERHGGQIWVESTPGEGTTFCFTLRSR